MNIRRLNPIDDEVLLREAYEWDKAKPNWFRQMDAVYGPDNFAAYIKAAQGEQRIDIGIFASELIGVFVLSERIPDNFEVHIMAKRGTDNQILANAAYQIRHQLFQQGAKSISGWMASQNKPLLKLAFMVGFVRTHLTMLKGSYHGRVVQWIQLVSTRESWLSEV